MFIIIHSNYSILNVNGNMLNGIGDVSVKDFLDQMSALKIAGEKRGITFKTSKEESTTEPDGYLFVDTPEYNDDYFSRAKTSGKPLFLLVWESGIVNPKNLDVYYHKQFSKVFTYDDTMVDNEKYIKIAYSFDIPFSIPKKYSEKKLCCLIAGNRFSNHPLELYSYRSEIIKWFETNHSDDFDLYGQGWTKIIPPKNLIDRVINKVSFLHSKLKPRHPSYRGTVEDKYETYQKYRFAICYENAKDFPGYISEKIFHCFFSGIIPIYLGAPNISQYIPKDCFIDRNNFSSIDDLYHFVSDISEEDYYLYLDAIESFLIQEQKGVFSIDYFTKTVIKHIL
jgi:hypothetical protein